MNRNPNNYRDVKRRGEVSLPVAELWRVLEQEEPSEVLVLPWHTYPPPVLNSLRKLLLNSAISGGTRQSIPSGRAQRTPRALAAALSRKPSLGLLLFALGWGSAVLNASLAGSGTSERPALCRGG